MSTESGKTCVECKIGWHESEPHEVRAGSEPYTHSEYHVVLCAKHDGSMAEKLAEVLRGAIAAISDPWKGCECGDCGHCGQAIRVKEFLSEALAAYDELQGLTCSKCHRPRSWHSEESGHMMDHPYDELQGRKG